VAGPQVITRYNNYRSVTVNGSPAPGVSSGTAIATMAAMNDPKHDKQTKTLAERPFVLPLNFVADLRQVWMCLI